METPPAPGNSRARRVRGLDPRFTSELFELVAGYLTGRSEDGDSQQ